MNSPGNNTRNFAGRGVANNAPLSLLKAIFLAIFFSGSFPVYAEPVAEPGKIIVHGQPDAKGYPGAGTPGSFSDALFDSIHSYDALSYGLDLNFPMVSDYFSGNVVMQFQVMDNAISSVRLHMVDLVADSAFTGTARTTYIRDDTSIVVSLGGTHYFPETLSVRIFYHDTLDGRGYYHYQRNSYTMAEPQDARWWFPCYDEPWDKALADTRVTVPEAYDVGSNGYLSEVIHNQANQTKTYHWISRFPVATYLINLIMGDFADWYEYYTSPQGDSIPIYYMVWREDSSLAVYDFATIPDMMRIFSEMFIPYPFEKYGQGVISPSWFGGMEHQTMTTLNRSWVTGDRAAELGFAHELAHMWWGDLITPADWRHTWLNEGFATYSQALFNQSFHGEEAFRLNMIDFQNTYYAYERSAGPGRIFDPEDLFGVHVYVKGAWVLHMLRGIAGDSAFFDGMRLYANRFAHGNASTDEFRIAMEETADTTLGWFFDEWVYGRGYPQYHYSWRYQQQGDSFEVHLEIEQVQVNSSLFIMPMTVRITAGGDRDFSIVDSLRVQAFDFQTPQIPIGLTLDPENWILDSSNVIAGTDEPEGPGLPLAVDIESVYPNPFNGAATIEFSVRGDLQDVRLQIYDIEGRLVRKLLGRHLAPSRYRVTWTGRDDDGREVASGIYFIRLAGHTGASLRKITYLK
jgi:aminopeptidase N